MIDPKPRPSRLLRITARITPWILGFVLAFWLLLLAGWGVLHGFIVPRIGEWRGHVERLATDAMGAPVRIAHIAARSEGLLPTFELQQLRLLNADQQPALELEKVVVTVSLRSVLRGGIEQVYVQGPSVNVHRQANGQWRVGGVVTGDVGGGGGAGLRWLLEQPEVVVQQGRLHITDAMHPAVVLDWQDVQLVMRNGTWKHAFRLDAINARMPAERIHLTGVLKEPVLPSAKAPWERWNGQWYAEMQANELPPWAWPADGAVERVQVNGHAKVWMDVKDGQLHAATADLDVGLLDIAWRNPQTAPLSLHQLQGRLHAHRTDKGWAASGEKLGFQWADGTEWPRSNWKVEATGDAHAPAHWQASIDHMDVGQVGRLAQQVPLAAPWQAALNRYNPQGLLKELAVQWSAQAYSIKGQLEQLKWKAQPQGAHVGTPGAEGLNIDFSVNERGGQAQLQMRNGALHFPGVFEQPEVPIDQLTAQLRWSQPEGRLRVELPKVSFANRDATGNFHAVWQAGLSAEQRYPGVLDLEGVLEQADGAQVHRYLPLVIPATARHYVRDSVRAGQGRNVRFEVRGDLQHMPFDQPETGRFRIEAPLQHVQYDYVPASVRAADAVAWPALQDLAGLLIFDGHSMEVRQANTGFVGLPQLRMQSVQAHIPNLNHPHLRIQGNGRSELAQMLQFVRASPVAQFTSHAFDSSTANGFADLSLNLELPIQQLERSKITGHVRFKSNQLQINTQAPTLRSVQGAVRFSDQGFALEAVQAKALGGAWRLTGGMPAPHLGMHIQAEGTATAQGLLDDAALGHVHPLLRQAQGQSNYRVDVTAHQGVHGVQVQSDLRGMSLALPAPLRKTADEAWPLTVSDHTGTDGMERIRVTASDRLSVEYWHDTLAQPTRVVAGRIAVGQAAVLSAPPIQMGPVQAHVQLPRLDVGEWKEALATPAAAPSAAEHAHAYWPQAVNVQLEALVLGGRTVPQVRAQLVQSKGSWQGKVTSQNFGGYIDYQPPSVRHSSGLMFARLDRLVLPSSSQQPQPDTSLLTDAVEVLPALDIQVEELVVAGNPLGQLRMQARNQAGTFGRDWLLERFELQRPEARWSAKGSWKVLALGQARQTDVQFGLDVDDAGVLLSQVGMPGVIRGGNGQLAGHLSWQGTPLAPHWKSMQGTVHMDVTKGQFLKVEPGIGKLLSVLSLQSLPRRMAFDFRDVFSQGFAFDFVRGDVRVHEGVASTNNLQMKGVNAAVLMEGTAHLANETQDLYVVVVPEINAMTASLVATAINPVVGVGSFVAQMFLRGPLMEAATRSFHVHGPWGDPVVDSIANRPSSVPVTPRDTP